jgi:hypothetical protein
VPGNTLSAEERAAVLDICNSEEFASLLPSQIVPKPADQGRYLASESSFYRMPHARRGNSIIGAGQNAGPAQTTRQLQGQCALPGLDLGHHLDAWTDRRYVLLPLPDRGHLQSQDRCLGSS